VHVSNSSVAEPRRAVRSRVHSPPDSLGRWRRTDVVRRVAWPAGRGQRQSADELTGRITPTTDARLILPGR